VTRLLTRLRWQLTLSHLIAVAVTLVLMIAVFVLLVSYWTASLQDPAHEPYNDAQTVADAVGGLIVRDRSGDRLDVVLDALARGDLQLSSSGPPWASGSGNGGEPFAPSLENIAYIAVVGPDGRVLGSSDPAGAAFSPPERSEWAPLVDAALAGDRNAPDLVAERSGDGPAALGAYPVLDERDQPVAAIVVAKTVLPESDRLGTLRETLVFFGAVTAVLLVIALIFALLPAGAVAYLLARRLVGRLEHLGQAAESLAAGDLTSRVEEGPKDEVGQLARRFNRMAVRLADTVAALEAEKQHARDLLQAKRDLVANVSHELRTPLASIRGHTESLLMEEAGRADGRSGDYLAVIERETEQLSRLIDDLFVLATTEADALPLRLQPIALVEVIDEVAGTVRSLARNERQVTIVTAVDPDLPPVLADRERAVQVLGNLVRNALRYTPEGGIISLRTERRDSQALVIVEDTGVGIPPEQLPHIFDRFYQGGDARERATGGAGLGLAIVRELVEAMGGSVAVESAVGAGSRFSFTLPLDDAHPPPATAAYRPRRSDPAP
jgi:signal transduction histidine kinase